MIALILAQIPSVGSWWDIAQKIGSGAAFVMGIALVFLWRAYLQERDYLREEIKYSKDRDTQTLTVLLNLTKIIENLERGDKEASTRHEVTTATIIKAIEALKELITGHYAPRGRR